MKLAHYMRPVLWQLPFQYGKGTLAHYILHKDEIPSASVRAKSGVLVQLHQDNIYRDIYLYGEYEPRVTECIKRYVRVGFSCLDIGANFGYYSALLGRYAGREGAVHSFEPLPFYYQMAQRTIEDNGVSSQVRLNNVGLGAQDGEFVVYTFPDRTQGTASSNDLGDPGAIPHRCKVTTLDEYADKVGLKSVDFIKADVEGDELSVFRGGKRLLSRSKAAIVFEVNINCMIARGNSPAMVEDFLRECGYKSFIEVRAHRASRPVEHLAEEGGNYLALK